MDHAEGQREKAVGLRESLRREAAVPGRRGGAGAAQGQLRGRWIGGL